MKTGKGIVRAVKILLIGALVFAGGVSFAQTPRKWTVKAQYPVPEAAGGVTATVTWEFTVREERVESSERWWRVSVVPVGSDVVFRGEFWYQPERKTLRDLRVERQSRGEWVPEKAMAQEGDGFQLCPFGPLPVDLISPERAPGKKAEVATDLVSGQGEWKYRRSVVLVREDPSEGEAPRIAGFSGKALVNVRKCRVQDQENPGQRWEMAWVDGLPWWTVSRTPQYQAELTAVEMGE